MKKILTLIGAILTLCGCSNKATDGTTHPGFDSLFTNDQADSLVKATASYDGMNINLRFEQVKSQQESLTKEQFAEGFRYALFSDTATAFQYGIYSGIQCANQLRHIESLGLKVDREAYFEYFKKGFLADEVNEIDLEKSRSEMQELNRELSDACRLYQLAQLEHSPEAVLNVERGRQFIDSVAAVDSTLKIKASGVAIKIINSGNGRKVQSSDNVTLSFKARTPEGIIFDSADRNVPMTSSVTTFVKGLQEGLAELASGGIATIYVPGREAYGSQGNNRFRLKPNQLVIYDVEVIGIGGQ